MLADLSQSSNKYQFNMKFTTKLVAVLLFPLTVSAQKNEITNAILYDKEGNLEKAKIAIDKAVNHPKTMEDPKAWYTAGTIYEKIEIAKRTDLGAGLENIEKIGQAYQNAIKFDKPGGFYALESEKRKDVPWQMALNKGVELYQNKQYKEAAPYYGVAQRAKPQDTTAFVYGAYNALSIPDYDLYEQHIDNLDKIGYNNLLDYYIQLINGLMGAKQNEKALQVTEKARKKYPTNKDLSITEIQLYFELGKNAQLITKLEEGIKLDPENSQLYSTLGSIYDQAAKDESKSPAEQESSKKKALELYQKAIDKDPKNFDAHFNMGIIYYNEGVEIDRELSKVMGDFNAYKKNGAAIEAKAKAQWEKTIKKFEDAFKLDNSDQQLLRAMRTVYAKLKRIEDAKRIDDMLGGK
jgi:Tfp pilus assembly protein PilF